MAEQLSQAVQALLATRIKPTVTGRSFACACRPLRDGAGWSLFFGEIISLYAGGMALWDIQHYLVSTIGVELSH
jgi:hypothetical protein